MFPHKYVSADVCSILHPVTSAFKLHYLSQLRLFGLIHTCHTSEDAVFHCQSEDFRGYCFCLLLLHLCPTIRAVVWNPKWCFFVNVSVFAFVALYRHMVLSGVMYPPALYVVHSSLTSSGSGTGVISGNAPMDSLIICLPSALSSVTTIITRAGLALA